MSDNRKDIGNLARIVFLDPTLVEFYKPKTGFLGLKYDGKDYTRVNLQRTLPHQQPNSFISVLDGDSVEIGMLRSLDEMSDEQKKLVETELALRYYCPQVLKINSAKDKMGYVYFDLETDAGNRNFPLKDISKNILRIHEKNVLLIDVYGNRYIIDDINKLERASFKKLETFLL